MAPTSTTGSSDDREPNKTPNLAARLESDPPGIALPTAAAARAFGGVETFHQQRYEDLPSSIKEQLRTDGMHGSRRTDAEAKDLYELRVNAETQGSIEGVQAVVNNQGITE